MSNANSTVQISIYETTLPNLLRLKRYNEEGIAELVKRLVKESTLRGVDLPEPNASAPYVHRKYVVDFLGSELSGDSLGKLYGCLVDALFEIAPDCVAKLAEMRARTRRYVSIKPSEIHPGSPHLPVLRTKSGFYVSKNIGKVDFIRGLKALCEAGNLNYGTDLRSNLAS